jgi:hypothetical protein
LTGCNGGGVLGFYGGADSANTAFNKIYSYNTVTDTWTAQSSPTVMTVPARYPVCVRYNAANNTNPPVLFIGGGDSNATTFRNLSARTMVRHCLHCIARPVQCSRVSCMAIQ